ncbi:ABC transporter ATP-binding protein [Nakamurella aerolata]|uniref:ABC transporter ATP-binding protein n=1 Tax=Nakamurella aerolata TaxID=1656892 RepID=A0A849ABU4_9ACTN|nr:ABC transporter ATP-binding protein [Nakamurella aerolata]NNG36621.1 ABC transporter ATP-binding protein [Nakamurella aerolata]
MTENIVRTPRTAPAAGGARRNRPSGASTPVAVQLQNLRKSFGKVAAVRGLNLTIQPGEIVAFLGPNGAGKTSTIDMLLGLSQPTSGSVQVFGTTPRRAIEHGLVSAVLQTGGLLRDLTVEETLRYTGSLFNHTQNIREVLQRAGIERLAGTRVGKCSGGEQQRLRFAMALLSDPALIVLDEPTTGMDVTGRRDFWTAIQADARRGRTVLFATHYLEEADQYANRIVLIRDGELVADGTSAAIKAQASGRTVRATLPGLSNADAARFPAVTGADINGEVVTFHTTDSDQLARFLLTRTQARDVEITAHSLDQAFIALTSQSPPGDGIAAPRPGSPDARPAG